MKPETKKMEAEAILKAVPVLRNAADSFKNDYEWALHYGSENINELLSRYFEWDERAEKHCRDVLFLLDRLNERDRFVLWLIYVRKVEPYEVADHLGVPDDEVDGLRERALDAFVKAIKWR